MVLPAPGHNPLFFEALQFLRSDLEHVALDVEQVVALRILKVVNLLVVTHF